MRSKQKLYLMKNDFGLYKIGISLEPKSRRDAISNSSGVPTHIVNVWDTRLDAYDVEQALHLRYAIYRRKGEWFEFEECPSENINDLLVGLQGEENLISAFRKHRHNNDVSRCRLSPIKEDLVRIIPTLEWMHTNIDKVISLHEDYWDKFKQVCLLADLEWFMRYGFVHRGDEEHAHTLIKQKRLETDNMVL